MGSFKYYFKISISMNEDTGKIIRVDFKLDIPLGQGNQQSLDYCLDVEFFGSEDEAERLTHQGNLDRLKRKGFDRNLFPYECEDIVFRSLYKREKGLEELALDLLKNGGWYGVDMIFRFNKERKILGRTVKKEGGGVEYIPGKSGYEFTFRMPDGTLCPFDAVLTEGNRVLFGKLAEENPDLFRFIYGHDAETIRKETAKHFSRREGILFCGGPFGEFLGGKSTIFYSGINDEYLHGMSDRGYCKLFHMGNKIKCLSRGVKYVKR